MPDESEVVQVIDVRVRLVLAGFDEADLLACIEQAAGEHAPGGARSDDDVVESFVRSEERRVGEEGRAPAASLSCKKHRRWIMHALGRRRVNNEYEARST